MTDATLELTDLRRSFTQAGVTLDVLRGIDAELKRGEIVALLGPSGSGKSTTLQAVGLLGGGVEGKIRMGGEVVTYLGPAERTETRGKKTGLDYMFNNLLSALLGRTDIDIKN